MEDAFRRLIEWESASDDFRKLTITGHVDLTGSVWACVIMEWEVDVDDACRVAVGHVPDQLTARSVVYGDTLAEALELAAAGLPVEEMQENACAPSVPTTTVDRDGQFSNHPPERRLDQ